ncbi:MAG TPA: twin-arginine translocase TatA/TatE family subunit [Desulfomonilaceae bacterium]|nr:twin-arginine translocase TatA/TatE family subunit [Desulfomonilaceae bacterium]
MGIPSPTELILILVVVVMVFGPKRIPEIMNQVGKGIKTFKDTVDGTDTPTSAPLKPDPNPVAARAADGKK